MNERYLNADECADLFRVKRETFVDKISHKAGFPKPYVISKKLKLWPALEVHEYIRRCRKSA